MSTLETNLVQPSTGTNLQLGAAGDTVDIPSGATLDVTGATVSGLTTGKVLQVQYLQTDTIESITSTTLAASQLTKSITPSSTSSKILVQLCVQVSDQYSNPPQFVMYRDGSPASDLIGAGATGSRVNATGMGTYTYQSYTSAANFSLIDEPSTTSATTYTLYWAAYSGSGTLYMNRSYDDADAYYTVRVPSSLILTEIAG